VAKVSRKNQRNLENVVLRYYIIKKDIYTTKVHIRAAGGRDKQSVAYCGVVRGASSCPVF
jgi:hypothetical protein